MHVGRAVAAGAIATGVMTALWMVEPSIGLPQLAVGHMLSTFMSVSVAHFAVGAAVGWVIHLIIGMAFAVLYAWLFATRLPGPAAARGALYGVMVFVLAQIAFMPLVGAGLFSRGDVQLLTGSLLGHLVYGAVTGWIYGAAA